MILAFKCVVTGENRIPGYLSIDDQGSLILMDKIGFQGGKWVGPNVTSEFEYIEYKVPTEPPFGFGQWRGLPNPLKSVDEILYEWKMMMAKLEDFQKASVATECAFAASSSTVSHPGYHGVVISVERYADAPHPGGWPMDGGGAAILHPAAVNKDATRNAVQSEDPYEIHRSTRVQTMEGMLGCMSEVRHLIEAELRASNCAALLEDTGLPTDDNPPKTGSLEHLRALCHPTTKALGIVKAVLLLLGEPARTLASWDAIRQWLVLRDQRNPWLNLHERMEAFDPSSTDAAALREAAAVIRKYGGEEGARSEWLCVFLLFKWTILMFLMNKMALRIGKFKPNGPRPRIEPDDARKFLLPWTRNS